MTVDLLLKRSEKSAAMFLCVMLLTLADYDFTYEIKDNQLYIDFVNESAHDATYEFSVKGDTLILIGGEGTIGGTYELTKVHDKKADK